MLNQQLETMKTEEKANNKMLKNVLLTFFIVATLGATFFAYKQYDENVQLQEFFEHEKLAVEEHVQQSFDQIEANLAQITATENNLKFNFDEGNIETGTTQKERIQQKINLIEHLISENKRIIEDLNNQVVAKNKRLATVGEKVIGLNKKIKDYEAQTAKLKKANDLLAKSLEELTVENNFLSLENEHQKFLLGDTKKIIAQKDDTINMAFYVTGTFDKLKESKIVAKEGGIIGIGTTKSLQEDFDKGDFIQVDKRNVKTIPVYSKKAKIITNHSTDSYELIEEDGVVNYIKITNPDLFWEKSKFLVIETKGSTQVSLAKK